MEVASGRVDAGPLRQPFLRAGLLLVGWIVVRPYLGVVHDAFFYAGQALRGLEPGPFGEDLFFAYGSQDAFTVFSPLYKPLIVAFGLGPAHLAMTLAGELLWLGGLAALMRTAYGGATAWAAAAGAALMHAGYGGLDVFQYGEPFATPRLFVEGLVLAALAAGLKSRWIFTALLLMGAAALHPLMALTGAAVLALMTMRNWRAWAAVALVGAGCVAAAAFDVQPFNRLMARFDPEWLQIARGRAPMAFITAWRPLDYLFLASSLAMLVVVRRSAEPQERRLVDGVLAAAGLGCLATLIGGDFGLNVLVVNAQPWRVLWLATLMANASTAVLLLRRRQAGVAREFLAANLLCSVVANLVGVAPVAGGALGLIAALAVALEDARQGELATPVRIALRGLACLAAVAAVAQLYFTLARAGSSGSAIGLLILCLALGSFLALRRFPRFALVLGLVAGLSALIRADGRDPWQRVIEDPTPAPGLEAFLADGGRTYWESSPELLWLKLHRESYYSCTQGAGVIFYRGTALEYARRGRAISGLNTSDFDDRPGGRCGLKPRPDDRRSSSRNDLVRTCLALPELDTLVLTRQIEGAGAAAWRSPVPKKIGTIRSNRTMVDRFYRYDCRRLRG